MPKTKSRTFFSYSEENLKNAIEAVTQNGMSKKTASRRFNIPRSTLIRRLSMPTSRRRMGPATELSEKEEKVIEEWIIAMARKGFPVHKQNLILSVKKIIEDTGRETKYLLNKTPGRSWFQGFLKRHPNIKQKYAESVSKARAAVTQDRIESWFDEILTFLQEENYDSILSDPSRIFNGDEAGFCLCPKSGKVLGPAETKEDFYVRVTSEKEQITVMATFSADGKYVPPMLIFPYKRIPQLIAESVPEDWSLGRSDSGWMTSVVFYEYISNHFLPYIKSKNIPRPVILFVDGHRSHLTKEVSQLCDENGIILVSLFPNTTHIMQPADVSVFRPLKAGWTSEVRNWKFQNFPKEVTRHTFGTILKTVFDKYASEKSIQNGFRKSGLYPFDKRNVDYSKCIPNRKIFTDNVNDNTNLTSNRKDRSRISLEVLEEKIENELHEEFLKTFENKENWSGDISCLKLYNVWATIKIDIENDQKMIDIFKENSAEKMNDGNQEMQRITEKINENDASPKRSEILTDINKNNSPVAGSSRQVDWNTPPQKKICYEEKENQGYKVPTPFKKCLVFPETSTLKTPKQKRKIFPAVVSSGKYREFYEKEVNKKKTQKTKQPVVEEDSTSESDTNINFEDEDLDISEPENLTLITGQYVIVKYEENYFPGIILKHDLEGAEIRTMVSAGINSWKWPVKEDILFYFKEDIICNIQKPQLKNSRGHYRVPEIEKYN